MIRHLSQMFLHCWQLCCSLHFGNEGEFTMCAFTATSLRRFHMGIYRLLGEHVHRADHGGGLGSVGVARARISCFTRLFMSFLLAGLHCIAFAQSDPTLEAGLVPNRSYN